MVIGIMLKYERIGCFCYYCGHLGHEVRTCNEYLDDVTRDAVREEMMRAWFKAYQIGRRVEMNRENMNLNLYQSGF